MSVPRFHIITTRTAYTWRFVAGNGRTLARADHTHPTIPTCLEAIQALQARIGDTVLTVDRDLIRYYLWRLTLNGRRVARANTWKLYAHTANAHGRRFRELVTDAEYTLVDFPVTVGAA